MEEGSARSPAAFESHYYKNYRNEKILMDIMPVTAYMPNGLKLMKDKCGDVKILLCMRNPAKRAYSSYNHAVRHLAENRTIQEIIELEKKSSATDLHFTNSTLLNHIWLSRYELFLPFIFETFGQENIYPILYEDYFGVKRNSIIKEICDFLGVGSIDSDAAAFRNKGEDWGYFINRGKVKNKPFCHIGSYSNRTKKTEKVIREPSDQALKFVRTGIASLRKNKAQNASFEGLFESTVRYCEKEIFKRSLPSWND
ncbi:sulfotransferase domain-containing protein [Temperatibacter marinus]|uniref:Sulfotransferase domain-containing protein n=1 Tax=Temperatibacter marinus TaxID=1456591 RepID=A0AA52EIK9_9PROT|nr:sulfotransferase domain-containing protein [Temperatibacter marinus]WND03207.1 sulfotransferase domain-containing protein [Temperatibacter marinus]